MISNKKPAFYLFCIALLLIGACKKNDPNKIYTDDAYVIGVDTCPAHTNTTKEQDGKGYVLLLPKSMDTVLTYNLPKELVLQVDAKSQVALKENYLFPTDIVGDFKFKLSFRYAQESEYKQGLCFYISTYVSGLYKVKKQVIIVP